MDPLTELADKYETDKGNKGWAHKFTEFYHKHLEHLRNNKIRLLEIGVQGFKSHYMWKEYFPNAQVYGMDCSPLVSKDNIEVFVGNQGDRKDLIEMMNTFGGQWNIIIDDGGHRMWEQQITLAVLFQYLKSGGLFVVEDLHTSNFGAPFGVKEDLSNSTLLMLKKFKETGKIESEYMSDEEKEYLNNHISNIEIMERDPQHITAIVWKTAVDQALFRQWYELMVELRNRRNVDENFKKFDEIIKSSIDKITDFNIRWCISVCDTYADFGTPDERRNAMMISLFVNLMKIGDSMYWGQEPNICKAVIPTFNGLNTIDFRADNMILNLSARLNRLLKETPHLWKIWRKIITAVIQDFRHGDNNRNFIRVFYEKYERKEWFFTEDADLIEYEVNQAIYNTPTYIDLNKVRVGG